MLGQWNRVFKIGTVLEDLEHVLIVPVESATSLDPVALLGSRLPVQGIWEPEQTQNVKV